MRRVMSLFLSVFVLLVSGFVGRNRTNFDEITVQRINIVEPGGTLRTIISSKAAAPGVYVKGKEEPREDPPTAGMIFLNDEGSEIGGLMQDRMVSCRSFCLRPNGLHRTYRSTSFVCLSPRRMRNRPNHLHRRFVLSLALI